VASKDRLQILDPLYGDIEFSEAISGLIRQPLLQRLRHIRLSNIDSIQMPGISGITRFEHALGTAFLAANVAFSSGFAEGDRTLLQAAALIHDSAITPYGHLVEEALQYVDAKFDHENKWSLLMAGADADSELGGMNLQLYLGRRSGLPDWASRTYAGDFPSKLKTLLEAIQGRGAFGPCIAGDLDLDNIDNVTRMAFHMGLRPDIYLPKRLCSKMLDLGSDGTLLFDPSAVEDIRSWSALRHLLYDRLMPSPLDFIGKIMLLFCTVHAFRTSLLDTANSWMMTDADFIATLLGSADNSIRDTAQRWLLGELWELSDLIWMEGTAPNLARVGDFSDCLSEVLGRQCFSYRIKDKRDRKIVVRLTSGESIVVGTNSNKWILGVASPLRKAFTSDEQIADSNRRRPTILTVSLTNSRIRAILDGVDWNFPASTAIPTSVHSLHWFPGNFIPQIPSFLIQALSTRKALVADPFGGSGTTGIEALLLDRRAWLGDANSIAVSIAKAKASLLTSTEVRQNFEAESRNLLKPSFHASVTAEAAQSELHPELAMWFHPDTFSQLLELWTRIEWVEGSDLREVFRVAFSDVLFSCASSGRPTTSGGRKRRHHWGWIADNVKPKILLWHDANRLFLNSVEAIGEAIRALPRCDASCIDIQLADARATPLQSSSVDLIVTSPPYLAMIDYSTAQRLTYMWRGLSMDAERRQELGARWRRNRISEERDYESAIALSLSEIERVLKPSALCAIVIGASRKFPNMAEKVIASFASKLETVWGPVPRTPTRRRVYVRQGEAPTEYICVFRKTL
jgi:uncharacterized protein